MPIVGLRELQSLKLDNTKVNFYRFHSLFIFLCDIDWKYLVVCHRTKPSEDCTKGWNISQRAMIAQFVQKFARS